jgi:hypothetical protein
MDVPTFLKIIGPANVFVGVCEEVNDAGAGRENREPGQR